MNNSTKRPYVPASAHRWLRRVLGKAGRILGVAGLAAALHWTASAWQPAQAASRPNIIYILADDMGHGDAGFNGQTRIQTPHMDQLAREGMVFTQHYSGSTVCTPSRACLMTGLHTGHVTCDRNSLELPMPDEEVTVAEVLGAAGYATHFIGKWGLGGAALPDDPHLASINFPTGTGQLLPTDLKSIPTTQGFDTSLAYLNQVYAHFYYPMYLWQGEERQPLPGNASPDYAKRRTYSHDAFEEASLEIIESARGETPFYLQLSYTLPHRETKAPPGENPYADKDWPPVEKAYAAMITYLDATVGRVMRAVDGNEAIAENTLIFFSSDNGPQSTDGHSPFFFDSNGPLRGSKRDLYEGGIRAPTVARWKGVIAAGSRSDHISAFWDFLPTAAELAGAGVPADIDGISMAPTLTGKGEQGQHEYLYWEFHEPGAGPLDPMGSGYEPIQRQAVRKGNWKLVMRADGERELYDLSKDLGEQENLAPRQPAVVAELVALAREAAKGPGPVVYPEAESAAGESK